MSDHYDLDLATPENPPSDDEYPQDEYQCSRIGQKQRLSQKRPPVPKNVRFVSVNGKLEARILCKNGNLQIPGTITIDGITRQEFCMDCGYGNFNCQCPGNEW
jgi:hypothetical protein